MRARALRDDDLAELSDAEREWVWRSVLKGIRIDETCVLALVDLDELDQRLDAVRSRYEHRTRDYKLRRAHESFNQGARRGTAASAAGAKRTRAGV